MPSQPRSRPKEFREQLPVRDAGEVLPADVEISEKPFQLTPREREIVAAVVAGYANKEIAQKFALSEDTVKHHLTNIFNKTGFSNRLELAVAAIHHGLVGEA